MKRMIAIFLLITTLFASGHATLAFHYCGGNLREVGWADASIHSCCCQKVHADCPDNQDSVDNLPCCRNHFIQITTDDYPAAQQTMIKMTNYYDCQLFICFALNSDAIRPEIHNFQSQQVFPPGHVVRRSADMRHLICTYLI